MGLGFRVGATFGGRRTDPQAAGKELPVRGAPPPGLRRQRLRDLLVHAVLGTASKQCKQFNQFKLFNHGRLALPVLLRQGAQAALFATQLCAGNPLSGRVPLPSCSFFFRGLGIYIYIHICMFWGLLRIFRFLFCFVVFSHGLENQIKKKTEC